MKKTLDGTFYFLILQVRGYFSVIAELDIYALLVVSMLILGIEGRHIR